MVKPRMIQRFLLLLLPCILAILPACKKAAPPATAQAKLIMLLSADSMKPYEMAQTQMLMRQVFNREGYNLKTLNAAGSVDIQTRQLAEALPQKPYAIIISPVDAAAISDDAARALKEGILVIGLGESAATLPCSTSLWVDQRQLGRLAGEIAVRALKLKNEGVANSEIVGRIVELRGDENSLQSNARHEGFMEEIVKAPGQILVHDAAGDWSRQGGIDRTVEAVRLQSRFDILYAHNDSMALGAAIALGAQRQDVLIIGTDGFLGEEGGLSLVNSGMIDASIHQPLLMDLAWQIIQRRAEDATFTPKPKYAVAPLAITPKTVDDIRRNGAAPLPAL